MHEDPIAVVGTVECDLFFSVLDTNERHEVSSLLAPAWIATRVRMNRVCARHMANS